MAACTNEDAQVVQLLVTKGADVHARDGTEVSHELCQHVLLDMAEPAPSTCIKELNCIFNDPKPRNIYFQFC